MSFSKHYVLAAGGTGGHMIPAYALARELVLRGHRVALIARALARRTRRGRPVARVELMAPVLRLPAGERQRALAAGGMATPDGPFRITQVPRYDMAAVLGRAGDGPVVVDRCIPQGLHVLDRPLVLIVGRGECEHPSHLRLPRGRQWDLLLIANPAAQWRPRARTLGARRIEAVGWLHDGSPTAPGEEAPGAAAPSPGPAGEGRGREIGSTRDRFRVLLIPSGSRQLVAQAAFQREINVLLRRLRALAGSALEVWQLEHWERSSFNRYVGVDRVVRANALERQALSEVDLAIGTPSYECALKVAASDVPMLVIPEPPREGEGAGDDFWGRHLGEAHTPDTLEASVRWMEGLVESRGRRAPMELGPSGVEAAARLIARFAEG